MIERRHFLGSAAGTAAFFAMHDLRSLAGQAGAAAQVQTGPRILSVELLSGAPMSVMKAFYGTTLDLAILEERADRLTVQAGDTRITFVSSPDTVDGRPPFYHFAFNVPRTRS